MWVARNSCLPRDVHSFTACLQSSSGYEYEFEYKTKKIKYDYKRNF